MTSVQNETDDTHAHNDSQPQPTALNHTTPSLNTPRSQHHYTSTNHSPLRVPSPFQPLSPTLPSPTSPPSLEYIPTQDLSQPHRLPSHPRPQHALLPHHRTGLTSGEESAQADSQTKPPPLTGLHDWDPNIENRRLAQVFGWKQDPNRPFYDNAPDVVWEEIDPNAGKLETRWNGVFRKGRAYSFPLRRRHQGRRDSWSPVRGQSRGHITRDNFKMPRTGFEFPDLDTEWKVNRRLWVSTLFFLTCRLTDFIQDLIQTEDPTLPDRDEDVFRCGQCNFFKWPWRFSKPMQQKPVEDRMCWKCEQHALSLDRMRAVPEE